MLGKEETPEDGGCSDARLPGTTLIGRLANEIEHQHREVERKQGEALAHARKAGELLIHAKTQLQHGEFGPFLRERSFSWSTANLYMALDRNWERIPKSLRVGNLSLRSAAKLLYSLDRESEEPLPPSELCATDSSEILKRLGIRAAELEHLSKKEMEIFLAEIESVWSDCCEDAPRTGIRRVEVDAGTIMNLARQALQELRDGEIGYKGVRRILRLGRMLEPGQHGEEADPYARVKSDDPECTGEQSSKYSPVSIRDRFDCQTPPITCDDRSAPLLT